MNQGLIAVEVRVMIIVIYHY